MEIIKIKCFHCGKEIYVKKRHLRDKMFCTIRCLDLYRDTANKALNSIKVEHCL